jgi:serine/threonine protein kinase
MRFFVCFSLIQAKEKDPVKIEPPVYYEYTAVATAYFDSEGNQLGLYQLPLDDGSEIGLAPSRFPRIGDRVSVSEDVSYVVEAILGEGTGSAVYRATTLDGDDEVAIKFQRYLSDERHLSVETDFLVLDVVKKSLLPDLFSSLFPQVYLLSELGTFQEHAVVYNLRYMVMELLGESAWARLKSFGFRLPMYTVACIGIQILEILENLHSVGIIHGDIHPENILFKRHPTTKRIVLGDYGKSSAYLYPDSRAHVLDAYIPLKAGRNMLFLSPFELACGSPSRREDIFRLMETLARLYDEKTYSSRLRPLQNNKEALLNAKRTIHLSEIFPDVDPLFAELFEYGRSLGFSQRPDYAGMRSKFLSIILSTGRQYTDEIILDF